MTLYIEDLIEAIAYKTIQTSFFDRDILDSFFNQLISGKSLTDKQRQLSLKILKKYKKKLSDVLNTDVNSLLENPVFRMPSRIIDNENSISISKNQEGNTKIFVKFPYNQNIVKQFKEYRKSLSATPAASTIFWNSDKKYWEFGLDEPNVLFLSSLLDSGFTADDQFHYFFEEITKIIGDIQNYVPMLVYQNETFLFKNVAASVPILNASCLIDALLKARDYGITCWDDDVDDMLTTKRYNEKVVRFFKNSLDKYEKIFFTDVHDLIKHSESVLFVIPGGNEFNILKEMHEILINDGVLNEQISVLFRLETVPGWEFNSYIKDHSLNGPITEKTKYIFVSGKLPKPLIESNKNFNLVLQFGMSYAHYSLQEFVKMHHSVINLTLLNQTGEQHCLDV